MNDAIEANELAERYVAVWKEADAERRRRLVRELWSEDGIHILQPTVEARAAASAIAMTAVFEARGHAALEARVARAHELFVAPGGYAFRSRGNAMRVRDAVRFGWEMVRTGDGHVEGAGLEVLILDADGRIRLDYQFIES